MQVVHFETLESWSYLLRSVETLEENDDLKFANEILAADEETIEKIDQQNAESGYNKENKI